MRRADWEAILTELRDRGHADIESGAFLLANRPGDPRLMTRVIYYNELDPNCLVGGIHFHGVAYGELWTLCRKDALAAVGDVHTHPGSWVHKSDIDKSSPIVAQKGHLALIVPHSAQQPTGPTEVGVHLYDGQKWTAWTGREAAQRLFVRRFA